LRDRPSGQPAACTVLKPTLTECDALQPTLAQIEEDCGTLNHDESKAGAEADFGK
jgi:hypothetical protein